MGSPSGYTESSLGLWDRGAPRSLPLMSVWVLVGENDAELRNDVCRFLRGRGYRVSSTRDGNRVMRLLRREPLDVAVVDLQLPHLSGPRLLATNAARPRPVPLIAVASETDIFQAVAALRGGVYEYLTKPYEAEHLEWLLQRACAAQPGDDAAPHVWYDAPEGAPEARPLFAFSRPMQHAMRVIARAADGRTPVLLTGDAGTGKEMVARVLHHAGSRRGGPFVSFHPGSVPPDQIWPALFGGPDPRTGAPRRGLVEAADGGTLFIDQVSRLTPRAQERLLRLIRYGSVDDDPAHRGGALDVRLVASTRVDLLPRVDRGEMRQDFYWFVRAVTVRVPSLRERREDILPLARHLVERIARATDQPERILAPDASRWLQEHTWPGNVRELESVLVRGIVAAESAVIRARDLVGPSARLDEGMEEEPDESFEDLLMNRLRPVVRSFVPGPDGSELYRLVMDSAERVMITLALQRCGDNQVRAARLLGINRNTLRSKIDSLQIATGTLRRRR